MRDIKAAMIAVQSALRSCSRNLHVENGERTADERMMRYVCVGFQANSFVQYATRMNKRLTDPRSSGDSTRFSLQDQHSGVTIIGQRIAAGSVNLKSTEDWRVTVTIKE